MDILGYVQLFGIPAIGVTVAVYQFTRKDKKDEHIKSHLKYKIDFLGSILFQLDRMRFTYEVIQESGRGYIDTEHPNAERYASTDRTAESITADINEKLQQNYSMFSQKLMKYWVDIRTNWHNPSVIEKVPKFRKVLVEEYNSVVDKYYKKTGIKLEHKD
jgi:hypothetical protein